MSDLPIVTAVRQRRTVYHFRSEPLPDGVLEELLDAAAQPPNHHRTQPWHFVVVRGAAKERLADLRLVLMEERSQRDGKPVGNVQALRREVTEPPVLVYVVQRLDPNEKRRQEDYAACAITAYILQLTAWERGVGARWHTGQLAGHEPRVRAFLGLADDEEIVCYLALGYASEVPPAWARQRAAERTRYIE